MRNSSLAGFWLPFAAVRVSVCVDVALSMHNFSPNKMQLSSVVVVFVVGVIALLGAGVDGQKRVVRIDVINHFHLVLCVFIRT